MEYIQEQHRLTPENITELYKGVSSKTKSNFNSKVRNLSLKKTEIINSIIQSLYRLNNGTIILKEVSIIDLETRTVELYKNISKKKSLNYLNEVIILLESFEIIKLEDKIIRSNKRFFPIFLNDIIGENRDYFHNIYSKYYKSLILVKKNKRFNELVIKKMIDKSIDRWYYPHISVKVSKDLQNLKSSKTLKVYNELKQFLDKNPDYIFEDENIDTFENLITTNYNFRETSKNKELKTQLNKIAEIYQNMDSEIFKSNIKIIESAYKLQLIYKVDSQGVDSLSIKSINRSNTINFNGMSRNNEIHGNTIYIKKNSIRYYYRYVNDNYPQKTLYLSPKTFLEIKNLTNNKMYSLLEFIYNSCFNINNEFLLNDPTIYQTYLPYTFHQLKQFSNKKELLNSIFLEQNIKVTKTINKLPILAAISLMESMSLIQVKDYHKLLEFWKNNWEKHIDKLSVSPVYMSNTVLYFYFLNLYENKDEIIFNQALSVIEDYISIVKQADKKIDLNITSIKRIEELHVRYSFELRNPIIKVKDHFKKLNLPFELIEDRERLYQEGKIQHHCVNSYGPEINSGRCAIYSTVFNKKRYTIEIIALNSKKFRVGQIQSKFNNGASKKIKEFVNKELKLAMKRINSKMPVENSSHLF